MDSEPPRTLRGPFSPRPRVVLLNPPASRPVLRDNYCGFMAKAAYLWPPIDLLVQSGWLASHCRVSVVDAVAEALSPRACLGALARRSPEVVFILSSGATFEDDAAFAARIREKLPGVLLVVGLAPLVAPPHLYLARYPAVDAVLTDYSSADLRNALIGQALHGELVTRESGPWRPCDEVPPLCFPVPQHSIFPLDRYSLPLGWTGTFSTVLTGFGCAHSCSFCTGSVIRYRRRRREEVLAELEVLQALGIKNLFFVDYTFTSSRRYVLDLCRDMVERGLRFRWTCFGRVDQLTDEVILAMQHAGCDLVQIGVESGDDGILTRYHKGFTVAQVRQAFARCRSHGLATLAFFIIGLPGETRQTVLSTIELALDLDPSLASFSVPTPDPGTALLDEARKRGLVGEEPTQVLSTVGPAVPSEDLSPDEVLALRDQAIRRFYLRPAFLWRRLRSLRSPGDLRDQVQNAMQLFLRRR